MKEAEKNKPSQEVEKNNILKEADKRQSSSDKQAELPDSQQGKSKMLEADITSSVTLSSSCNTVNPLL